MQSDNITIGGARNPRRGTRGQGAVAAAALLLAGSVFGWVAGESGGDRVAAAAGAASAAPAIERLSGGAATSFAPVVDRVTPAVVTIRAERSVRTSAQQMPAHPLFREFFGDRLPDPRGEPRRQGGMGSGVIVRNDGYVLTNNHVVDGAEQVTVELSDGRTLKGKVIGTDAPTDLAVLKIDAQNLATLTLGDSDSVRVGDVVLAVGNPMGIGQTVTMGIVSAKGRATGLGDGSYEDFIQTDAPINRGNSGGALVSTDGELIGINSQILTPSGGSVGIGFAIPANMARSVMTQLIERGQVRRGRLGVTIQQITPELAQGLGLSTTTGALVSDVETGGPAAAAGVQRGDVITALNGAAVSNSNELRNEVAQLQPGADVTVTLTRRGKSHDVRVTLAELAGPGERASRSAGAESGRFGLSLEPLTADRARELGVRARTGLVVAGVESGSRVAHAGLQVGDVIAQVDGQVVRTADDLRATLASGERPAVLLVHRQGATLFLTVNRVD